MGEDIINNPLDIARLGKPMRPLEPSGDPVIDQNLLVKDRYAISLGELGKFKIQERLGHGATGAAYLAENFEGKKIVVKIANRYGRGGDNDINVREINEEVRTLRDLELYDPNHHFPRLLWPSQDQIPANNVYLQVDNKWGWVTLPMEVQEYIPHKPFINLFVKHLLEEGSTRYKKVAPTLLSIMRQYTEALRAMYSAGIRCDDRKEDTLAWQEFYEFDWDDPTSLERFVKKDPLGHLVVLDWNVGIERFKADESLHNVFLSDQYVTGKILKRALLPMILDDPTPGFLESTEGWNSLAPRMQRMLKKLYELKSVGKHVSAANDPYTSLEEFQADLDTELENLRVQAEEQLKIVQSTKTQSATQTELVQPTGKTETTSPDDIFSGMFAGSRVSREQGRAFEKSLKNYGVDEFLFNKLGAFIKAVASFNEGDPRLRALQASSPTWLPNKLDQLQQVWNEILENPQINSLVSGDAKKKIQDQIDSWRQPTG